LPERRYQPERWVAALNGVLPPGIRIMRCRFVSEKFHARFSAKGKTYRYRIWNAAVLPALEHGRAWHVIKPLDFERMKRAAEEFRGQHDFAAFAANRGTPETDTVRTIRAVSLHRAGPCLAIEFEGDGFLYKMVRMMVATIIQAGSGISSAQEIRARLKSPRTQNPHRRTAAPACGLFLIRVRY
jgi:tRNA pseudouridine38-40 synthase